MNIVTGDGLFQYCPRCGAENRVLSGVMVSGDPRKCAVCTWKVTWVGPIWGEAKR